MLLELLGREGPGAAMAALEGLAAGSEEMRRDGHAYAHAIGLAAYDGRRDVSVVFSECTPAFQSGCYHGVIESYFSERIASRGGHLDSTAVNSVCREQREDGELRWLLFQCAHGMGHGLSMVANYQLPASLAGCDLVADEWEREACYGGVFMENIVRVTNPHHEVGRPVAARVDGDPEVHSHGSDGHDHAGHGGAPVPPGRDGTAEFPPLKRDEPLYPCTVLEQRYLSACYLMQTSAILFFNGYNVPETAAVCASAPEVFRISCFQSLGRDVSSLTRQDDRRALRLCASAPEEYQPWCHVGYTKNRVDITADPADGIRYCRLLPPGESKRVCYVAVGEESWALTDDASRREATCAMVEPEFREACRHGAALEGLGGPESPTSPDFQL